MLCWDNSSCFVH